MAWQYHPLLLLFFLGGLVALGVAGYCWHYVRRYGASYLVGGIGLLGLADAVWIFAAALKTAATGLEAKLLFYKLQFVGSWVAPSLSVVIALAFVGWVRWLTRRTLAVLFAVPLVGIPLVLLNPRGAMIVEPVIVQAQGIRAFEHSFPPLFVLFTAWALGGASFASVVFAYAAVDRIVPWRPALVGALVFALPAIVASLKMGGIYPPGGRGINVTPAVNGIALSLLAVAIVRYRVLELLPIGRDRAVETMPDGYALVGPEGAILDANRTAADLLADGPERDLQGRSVREVVPVYDDIAGEGAASRFETDGRTVEVRGSSVTRQHQPVGRVLLLQDVTEKRERERELERTNERLDQFASVVSHDLRNPLNVAEGRIDLAQEEGDSEHLDAAANALDRMGALIDDVLTLARQGQEISETEAVALSSVADRCWAVVKQEGATMTVEDDLTFAADENRLQQLLENLFRNAVEHGSTASDPERHDAVEHAGGDVTIRVGALDAGAGFYVADDGPGIPPEDRETVFEYGHSTASEGTGFGLAIVDEIAEAHGWEVTVAEAADGGARFEITGVDSLK